MRFEIYTPIHKGLRRDLSLLAIKAGKLDCENHEALHALVDGIRTHAALVDLHHTLEERSTRCWTRKCQVARRYSKKSIAWLLTSWIT